VSRFSLICIKFQDLLIRVKRHDDMSVPATPTYILADPFYGGLGFGSLDKLNPKSTSGWTGSKSDLSGGETGSIPIRQGIKKA
jgi:hypothetical protein